MNNIITKIKGYYSTSPLGFIIIVAVIVRLIAVVFSKGFAMHDDHFLYVENPQAFVDGYDNNHWLPSADVMHPGGHSWFYPGLMYILFSILGFLHIHDPQTKMYIVRFLHSAFSMVTIIYGYKITKKLSDVKTAGTVAWLLALYWLMPFFSVRNMVETVCIPFMVYATWLIINKPGKLWLWLIAGIIMSLAVSTRFQCALFVIGFALGLLILKKWKEFLIFNTGIILCFIIIQSCVDYFIWGRPFTELQEYINYNIIHATAYIKNPWYTYILFLAGILIPPVSLMFFWGYFVSFKKYMPLFLGVFVFILFHSIFPNKQERFILPVVPFFIMLGIIGWNGFRERSKFWTKHKGFLKGGWIFFWCINVIMLSATTTMYSKKARVEAMVYLSKYENIRYMAIEETNTGKTEMLPLFYVGQWNIYVFEMSPDRPPVKLRDYLKKYDNPDLPSASLQPRFVLFYGNKKLEQRVDSVKTFLPDLVFEKAIEPGWIDDLLHRVNPRNANETIFIYRNAHIIPERKTGNQ